MTQKFITSLHIQKLGHEIEEIRERGLFNIISKLDHGFIFDNDLARSKELLLKLFDWFLLEPCNFEDTVFTLIKRILKSESGKLLISHCGVALFKREINKIRTYVEPNLYHHLDEVLEILEDSVVVIPPLDLPVSSRSAREIVGSTATPIEGFIQEYSSNRQQSGCQIFRENFEGYVINPLKWQMLIEPDRQVLHSIEVSLKRPPEPTTLLHSSDFFCNILLHDFPAEVFLQRPSITLTFHDLLYNCPSTRVKTAVLNCLHNLTKSLQIRINHCNDPSMFNLKEMGDSPLSSRCSSPDSRKTASGQSNDNTERPENVNLLKTRQITFPHFCCLTFKVVFHYLMSKVESGRKSMQKGVNAALALINELTNLLALTIKNDIWTEESIPVFQDILKELNEILVEYGTVLENFRVESSSEDSNLSTRTTYLCLLQNCNSFISKMVPLDKIRLILPSNLKNSLVNSLVDVTLAKLYPETHANLLEYVQSFKEIEMDSFIKYQETSRVCASMSAAVQFLNGRSMNACEGVNLALKALPSLEFHKDLKFVKDVVELCAEKLPLYSDDEVLSKNFELLVLKLLGHNLEEIREEMYTLCHKRIVAAIGPKYNVTGAGVPGSQILFLLRFEIFTEIALFGVTATNHQIQKYAEDILIHVLKCKILVSEDIWTKILESLIPAMPILLCHACKNSALGRTILDTVDPDTAKSLFFPKIEIVRANIIILFSTDVSMREEAFSRLCWMLSSQEKSRELLPKLNNLHDKALPNVCQVHRVYDVNRNRASQNFYQPSSLQQVLDLLKSSNVEPVIRRSALTQISVMMEDAMLHQVFINNHGLEIVTEIIKLALLEKDFNHYPDSAIPPTTILKNICLYHARARHELGGDVEIYFNILRALFMFFTEERLKQDAVTLLFLLLFNEFIVGSPSKADFSIPKLLSEKLIMPFSCETHLESSKYFEESTKILLTSDRWCLSSIQVQWNSEIFGLEKLFSWDRVDYKNVNIADTLKLTEYDLAALKASSVEYCVRKYLVNVQNGTTHEFIIESIEKLASYIPLQKVSRSNEDICKLPWESTFLRFLKSLPSSEDDVTLLSSVLKLLKSIIQFYNSQDKFWLSDFLKNPANCLLDLITLQPSSTEEYKVLSQDLLALITACALKEQHFLDFYSYSTTTHAEISWIGVIEIIADNLRFNDNTHFYNLAHLDSLLDSLVHLTAILGWSNAKQNPDKILSSIVRSLCELIVVFHCGKGPTAASSVMGLSITRNVVLVLNHLLAEMQYLKVKWEKCFLEVEEEGWLKSFLVLWSSRDVVLRAGALQLFAGLSSSPRLAIEIVNELEDVWVRGLTMLLDENEASIVKENCAYLLAHLIAVNYMKKEVVKFLEEFQFFKRSIEVFSNVYTNETVQFGYNLTCDSIGSTSETSAGRQVLTTSPALVKSLALLLLNLFLLEPDATSAKLQDYGLNKLLLRCICNPFMNVGDTKKLSLYCEIMEMDTSICLLLGEIVKQSQSCVGTVLHTKDCFTVVISLLDPHNYHTHFPQLIYLRNRLWAELFKLLAALCTSTNEINIQEATEIITETLNNHKLPFLQTLCISLMAASSNDLQNSAVLFLTTLLKQNRNLEGLFQTAMNEDSAGTAVCKILLKLHYLSSLKNDAKKKSRITACLTALLAVSRESKTFGFENGLLEIIVKNLRDFYTRLSLESVDCLRRVLDKRRICPLLKELNELIALATNFMISSERIKCKFAETGFTDLVHKLWVWFSVEKNYLVDVLKLLCTFTAGCPLACQTLPFTSSVAGSGLRKAPSKISLLHAILILIEKEMDQVSRTHNLTLLKLCFEVLSNSCSVLECRMLLSKSDLLQGTSRIHPAITKRQKPWETVELIWLEFLQIFSLYPEGQSSIAKTNDVFALVISLASSKSSNKFRALLVLRNVAFYQPNRPRLLMSDDFLRILKSKLESGNTEEISVVVLMIWSLAANNQRAKSVFKSAQLDIKLEQVLKQYELSQDLNIPDEINRIDYVLSIIKSGM